MYYECNRLVIAYYDLEVQNEKLYHDAEKYKLLEEKYDQAIKASLHYSEIQRKIMAKF